MKKNILKVVSLLMLASPAYAVELLKTEDSSFTVGGRVSVYGSNTESVNKAKNLLNLKDDSRISFEGTKKISDDVTAGGFLEWGLDANAVGTNFIKNRYGYMYLTSEKFGTLKMGKIFSVVNDMVFGATVDNLWWGTNDAGATSFAGGEGSDVGMSKLRSALVYDKKMGKVHLGLQFQGSGGDFEKNPTKVESPIHHDYGAGAVLAYEGDMFYASAGYTHSAYKIIDSASFDSSILDTNAYVGSVGLTVDKFKISTAGGYYQNYSAVGQDHLGMAVYTEYNLNKITPYAGFEVVYGLNPQSAVDKVGADLYGVNNRPKQVNYSMDRQNLAVGAIYKATDALSLIAEYNYDIRSKSLRESSAINPNKEKELTLIVRYNF